MKSAPLKEIKHLLPQDSHYYKDEYYLDKEVLLHEGDWIIAESLDLDQPELLLADGDCPEFPPFILVTGNMVAQNIFNDETDGSTGLIVLGNLTAENIVVGGQELYIKGNLIVNGLFWGDYNHGELIVEGKIAIKVFLNTDYHCDYDRFTNRQNMEVNHIFWDDVDDDITDDSEIRTWFKPEYLENEDELLLSGDEIWSWQSWLKKEEILEALKEAKNILNDEPISSEDANNEVIPSLFPNNLISLENLKIFTQSTLPTKNKDDDSQWNHYKYWDGDVYRKISVTDDKDPEQTQVLFQYNEEFYLLAAYYEDDKEVQITYNGDIFGSNSTYFFDFNEYPERYIFFQKEWITFQQQFSEAVYWQKKFYETITQKRFDDVLALPYVRAELSDYDDDDSIYHWKNMGWQFRQEDSGKDARITITKELNERDENDESIFEFYHIEFENGKPVLMTQHGNGVEFDLYYVHYSKTEKYKKAIAYFEEMEQKIGLLNQQYLKRLEQNANEKELLLAFIEMEDMQLQSGMFDEKWYAEHWETLKNTAYRADDLVNKDDLETLYFHLIRKDALLPYGMEHYELLEKAYKKQTLYFDTKKYGYPYTLMSRLEGLFIFGFDDKITVAKNNRGHNDFRRLLTSWHRMNAYTSINGILEAKESLTPYASEEYTITRIIKTLEGLGFVHDYPKFEADYQYTNLPFWVMMAMLILNSSEQAKDSIENYKSLNNLPFYEKQMEILNRLETAFK